MVTCIEVIEHVLEPKHEAARIAGLLRCGGCLYVTTPNFDSLSRRVSGPKWRAIEYPEHLNMCTPHTLESLLAAAGFRKRSLRTTGLSISDLAAALRTAHAGAQASHSGSHRAADAQLRTSVIRSGSAELALEALNAVLSGLKMGDTIKGFFVRI